MTAVYKGMKVNYLTVIDDKRIHNNGDYKDGYYLCKCECGNITPIKDTSLRTGRIRDCGCGEFLRRKHIGEIHGTLKVIDAHREVRSGKINLMLFCKCLVCGMEKNILASNINKYNNIFCSHNKERKVYTRNNPVQCYTQRLRDCWRNMNNRCYDETNNSYVYYGGKGISVCDEWHNSFKCFAEWAIKNGYKDNLTIERIDYNKNYCPENCKWITKEQQSKNTSRTRNYIWKGKYLTVAEIGRMENISQFTLYSRLNKGISIEDSVKMSDLKKEKRNV